MKNANDKNETTQHGAKPSGPEQQTASRAWAITSLILPCLSLCLCVSVVNLSAQTGGGFDLSHSVIATGGATSTGTEGGRTFRLDGTAGQNLAGTVSIAPNGTGGAFSLRGGFWAFDALAPTASNATISGRVLSADGQPIFRARVVLTDSNGIDRFANSNPFGYYRIEDIPVGQTYILTATSKQFQFVPQIVNIDADLTDLDITAIP